MLQEAPESHPVLRPHRIAIGLYDRGPGGLTRRRSVELDVTGERTAVPELIGERQPDLVLVNDDDLTFAKIRLDERSLRTLIASIAEFAESLPAALCWAAAWDMCRDAELRCQGLRDARAVGPAVGHRDQHAADDPAPGDAGRAAVRRSRAGGRRAWPSSPTALRALLLRGGARLGRAACLRPGLRARSRAPTADLGLLSGLLDGSAEIEGLAVDTDLRWQLLRRLVSRGVAGQDAIDAERDRDRTDAGERHALHCQAAIPDAAAKEAAWNQIISGELPNASFRAALSGFYSADQDELRRAVRAAVLRRRRGRLARVGRPTWRSTSPSAATRRPSSPRPLSTAPPSS